MARKEVNSRSPYAKALATPLFRRRVVKSGKLYSRKKKG